ncbi:HAMP domain-containing sensor histidine kinase [Clostridium vincentii]|uniref:histidine kinase n=1 Tax=Clostridium vincentii TaxID=52704 RepID=A0A2T0BIA4_9CLOT|nr:HAMP domain-containing sensor histidine kinase [Clostridium vincentii]PRR83577.1 Alkaline phosphatase synthesis sensor protein PhoR [Clostridium vincentii]
MNKMGINSKLKIFTVLIVTCAISITIYTAFLISNKNNIYPTVNKGRILTNSLKLSIEEALENNSLTLNTELTYDYTAIDLSGKVLASTIDRYKKDTVVNLKESIEYDNQSLADEPNYVRYPTPLIIDNKQVGTAIFLIPKEEFIPTSSKDLTFLSLLPIIIGVLAIIFLSTYLYLFTKKDILAPIASLHESACKILKGDFFYKIKYDYNTEIGGFCHDFEAMRDEIKFSKEKEVAIKVNEKELLACLSHDIKTPLTAIHGYVSGIKDGIVKDKEGIDNYCTLTLNRLKMLNKLLDDILEHSKAELNKMNIKLDEFYCEEFFRDILEDLYIEIESKNIKFKFPDEIPNILINGDKKRLSQVMYNLVSNSIKYSKLQGEIAVYFEVLDNSLYVYVKDNGIGISSNDVPNIFNKFYRGEKSRSQNIPGSGLGLSISKYIIEAHGGFIHCVESSFKGTIICFTLPL